MYFELARAFAPTRGLCVRPFSDPRSTPRAGGSWVWLARGLLPKQRAPLRSGGRVGTSLATRTRAFVWALRASGSASRGQGRAYPRAWRESATEGRRGATTRVLVCGATSVARGRRHEGRLLRRHHTRDTPLPRGVVWGLRLWSTSGAVLQRAAPKPKPPKQEPTVQASTKTPKTLGLRYSAQRGYWVGETPANAVPSSATQRDSVLLGGAVQEWEQDGWCVCRTPHNSATWAYRA